jgi:hypothetical protein
MPVSPARNPTSHYYQSIQYFSPCQNNNEDAMHKVLERLSMAHAANCDYLETEVVLYLLPGRYSSMPSVLRP